MLGMRGKDFILSLVASSAIVVPLSAQAEVRRFDIPAQPAANSLPQFARQAGLQILAPAPLTQGVRTQAVSGALEPRAALDALLAGTGLRVASQDGAVVTLDAGGPGRFPVAEREEASAVEAVVVTGTALQNQEAIAARRGSLTVVDALAQDDTGDLADQSLAEALSRVPSVSTMQVLYGEQESQYVAVRGITPDLNYVAVDGVGMISVANGGAGQRRVDLALIPSQAARRTEVYKTFTADQDAGAIGGVINIVPYSAFDRGRDKFYIDAFVNYVTDNDVPGGNSRGGYKDSPWSGGVKSLWTHRFGAEEKFGLVLSGTYQQRSYDDVKRNPNARTYYTATGASTTPDKADWNGFDPAPQAMVDYEFTSFIKTYGGSATFEFKPTQNLYSSLLVYDYKQTEDQTNNVFTLRGFTGLTNQTQHTGTLKIPDVRTAFNFDRFENETVRRDLQDPLRHRRPHEPGVPGRLQRQHLL
jgi:iron complex outermembrane receptor protein